MLMSGIKKISLFAFSLFVVLFLTGCESHNMILTNVSETDANQIIVLLESKGITASKTAVKSQGAGSESAANMWDISVDTTRQTEALAILNRIGLPRPPGVSMLELFPQQGLMKTDFEEKIRYNEGLNEAIATTIRKIDGILEVDVQIAIPEQDQLDLNAPKENPRASVFIKHDGVLNDPNNLIVQKIRRFVSGSVINLTFDDVTVVTDQARFTDISLASLSPKTEATPWGNQDFVKIWSIVVSANSASAFRTILFLFCLFSILFILVLGWMIWKFQNIFKKMNNYKEFLKPDPFELNATQVAPDAETEEDQS